MHGSSQKADKRGRGNDLTVAYQRSERTKNKRDQRGSETNETGPLGRRRGQGKHRHENVTKTEHKQPHEPKATENKMGECYSAVVGQNATFFIDCQSHTKQSHKDKSGQRCPAISSHDGQATGAAQIVCKKHAEQQ